MSKKAAFRAVQSFELGVLLRAYAHGGFEGEAVVHALDGQVFGVGGVFGGRQHAAVDGDRYQFEFVAVEQQRCALVGGLRVARHRQLGLDEGVVFADIDIKINGRYDEGGRGVVLEENRLGRGFAHGKVFTEVQRRGEAEAVQFIRAWDSLFRGKVRISTVASVLAPVSAWVRLPPTRR